MHLGEQAASIGALADDTRRALYAYVAAQPDPVGREQAAAALGIAQHNVNFHLDRLVDEGLLEVEYRRLSGRTGPGAGRPSKLYRRSRREYAVSLPERRYDLAGGILAAAVELAAGGVDLPEALRAAAHQEGRALGSAEPVRGEEDALAATARLLAAQGYEPHLADGVVSLTNCPFDALAQKHTALVCGLNKDFVEGLAVGSGCAGVSASLEPEPDRCCVKVRAGDPPRG
ncbi:helix-turn-helix transcriptional regulator [Nocardioides sp. MH1]|uniref:helix-turn-helix transcriptional regulator n=1 Tax=Nocardioides sp. MH1 TaxID=3242490 RepID=UPI0035210B71